MDRGDKKIIMLLSNYKAFQNKLSPESSCSVESGDSLFVFGLNVKIFGISFGSFSSFC